MGGVNEPIPLSAEDRAEGLRLERVVATAHDLLHVYQNDLNRFVGHMGAIYGVPNGWQLTDWLRGFEAPATVPVAAVAGQEQEQMKGANHHG
jgi:hypothetical protein